MRGPSLVAPSWGRSSSRSAGLSLSWPLLLRSTGSRRAGSVVVAHGPSCSAACGIFPDQGSNPRPLHWQADSKPLRHQGSPWNPLLNSYLQLLGYWFCLATLHFLSRLQIFKPQDMWSTSKQHGWFFLCHSAVTFASFINKLQLQPFCFH